MSQLHWNYFLAIEEDLNTVSRYIEFDQTNFSVFSLELARILMASTQEMDVLFKQICDFKGFPGGNEAHYRQNVHIFYPNLHAVEVEISRFSLKFAPFASWNPAATQTTPTWWTANNKVKHERHINFDKASLETTLNSVSALLIANLYFHDAAGTISSISSGPKYLSCPMASKGYAMSPLGNYPVYQVP